MPRLIARYPYLETEGGHKPIVWVGLTVNGLLTALPAAPSPERMRTGLSPRAGYAVEYSESQEVELQFFSRTSGLVGEPVAVRPELDRELDDPVRVEAPGPWYQYERLRLGQDFLQNFSVALLGSRQITVIFDDFEDGDEDKAD